MRSPAACASESRLSTNNAVPSPMTKPSALASNGREPVAERAPILQKLTKALGPMLRSRPPEMAASMLPAWSSWTAAESAASADAHAASVVKLGPRKLKSAATLPASTFASSPGIESSVMGGNPATKRSCDSATMAARTSAGSAANEGAAARSLANSGNATRNAVRSCFSPPRALPMMTPTRSGSTPQSGQPASTSAERAALTDHCWPRSICAATLGGSGSRQAIGSHGYSCTQPPIRE